jgi:putative endonuclease
MDSRHELGLSGEARAASYLEARGLRIVERRFQTVFGEIDLIARDRKTWVFIEVKTRSRAYWIGASDAITRAKQRRLMRTALVFIKKKALVGQSFRWDMIFFEGDDVVWIPNALEGSAQYTI